MIGKIDIWFSNVELPVLQIRQFESLLSPEELVRAHRFRFLCDRNRFIVQHGFLRLLLERYAGCGPRQINICNSCYGKPYLEDPKNAPSIFFSVSRSETIASFAFSKIGSIGVDIEKIRGISDMMDIVEQHFTPCERHEIYSCPESRKIECFYQFWTRKEAVLKAQGEGLLKPLDCVDVTANQDSRKPWKVLVSRSQDSDAFWVTDIDGPAGFAVAVAASRPFTQISVREFDGAGL
jgi:4'-phosphopantetheinyl transferase